MKAEVFDFSVGPGEFFIREGGLEELKRFYEAVRNNPDARLFELSTLPQYDGDESGWMADGDCHVILADDMADAKVAAVKALGKGYKHYIEEM